MEFMGPPISRMGSPQPKPQSPFERLIGNPLLLNLLAQSGYSETPQSRLGALGRAGLATQQQQQAQQMSELQKRLIESQIGLTNAKAEGRVGGANSVPSNVRSFEYFELLGDGSSSDRTRGENGYSPAQERFLTTLRSGQYQNIAGAGVRNLVTGDTVVPEQTIVSGLGNRALVEGEGGRGRVPDSEGGFSAVPGTAAALSEEEADKKVVAGNTLRSIQAQTVVEDVTRFNELDAKGEVPYGRLAAAQEGLPTVMQTDGYRRANALIESVKGNVGVDSLIRIKQSGAGLGQVPQSQLDLLSRLLGEMSLAQGREQFIRTWNRTGDIYKEIWEAADKDMREVGAVPPDVFPKLGNTPSVSNNEEYNALPSGTVFIAPDGTRRRKP